MYDNIQDKKEIIVSFNLFYIFTDTHTHTHTLTNKYE